MSSKETQKIKVWDLPTRLFHWSLLGCVIGAFITAKIGGAAMQAHFYFAYGIITLLVFRVIWGVIGNDYAKFTSFLPNPMAALRSLKGEPAPHLGHNPLGAFSVYAMLAALFFQGITGLFSNDDIASEGPWVVKISKETSDFITGLHKINEKIMIVLILAHVLALLYYRYAKKQSLVPAMITGNKEIPSDAPPFLPGQDSNALRLRGLFVFLISSGIVWFVVNKV